MDHELTTLLGRVEAAVEASFGMDADEASGAIRELIRELRAHPAGENNAPYCYGLGYCWYNMPEDSAERRAETETWLRRALTLDPGHLDARIFLGYHLFDQKRYAEAGELLRGVPAGAGGDPAEPWQDLKTRELIACCAIRLDPDGADPALIKAVCKEYLTADPEDSVVPAELLETLAWAVKHARRPEAKALAADACIALMNKLGLGEEFEGEIRKQNEGE